MIKRIPKQQLVHPTVLAFCKELAAKTTSSMPFKGDIDTNYSSRLSQATDNSVYQVLPQAIVFPKDTDDLLALTELANDKKYQNLKFTPKGGGTGTNGQALTEKIVVDMSRYMRGIIDFNAEEGWVKVQTGVIKDQLNDFLRPHGFFFAPDLSTSNRATIGGMINTDASGQGSLVYGKTSNHVLEMTAVTMAGDLLHTKRISKSEAEQKANGKNFEASLYRQALETCEGHRETILKTFPRLNRFLTGYDLENVFDEQLQTFDLGRLLTGSEGTLAFITEAKLNVTPIAKFKTMLNISYDSFDSALRNSPFLVEANATSVETVDSKVLGLAKSDVIWNEVSNLVSMRDDVATDGLNIVEFNDEDEASQQIKITKLCQRLDELINNGEAGVIGYTVTNSREDMLKMYAMRKKSVGLLGNVKGNKKPIAFAEDTAVPPENLADFIAEFRALLDAHELDYGMFGHVDAGVLHVRPALDLMDPQQEKLMRVISDQVVALTAKYKGLMWGEHGKGFRSEYGPEFFGEALFQEIRKIKGVFDPKNRLNPGKICTPINSKDKLVSVDATKRAYFDKQIPTEVRTEFATSVNCNGNGLCYNYDVSSVMCPSYKASNDRRFSPKGRATLMREWLRLQGENMTSTPINMAKTGVMQLLRLPNKLINTTAKALGQYDFSHEVKDSMDACLACKACTTACPVKVDVPTFRAQFLEAYYLRYFRKISDHLVANVEKLMPLAAKFPRLANSLMFNPIAKYITENWIGYVDAPKLTQNPESTVPVANLYDENEFDSYKQQQNVVFIVQDAFTSSFESRLVVDTVKALKGLGFKPVVLPFKANGKPEHVKGFLTKFSKTADEAAAFYNKIATLNHPMVGLDASMTLAYRDEYVKALGKDNIKFNVKLLSEWLVEQDLSKSNFNKSKGFDSVSIFNHCTEKSLLVDSPKHWPLILAKLGIKGHAVNTGCCGMAGTFGHEKANQETTKQLFDMSWRDSLNKDKSDEAFATGFSCRCQTKRFHTKQLRHPIQLIADLMD